MPRKASKKAPAYKNRTALAAENKELKAKLKELEAAHDTSVELQSPKVGPEEAAPIRRRQTAVDESGKEVAVFKSPYPGFKQRITPAIYIQMGINGYRIENLRFIDFAPFGLATVSDPEDIELMRAILADMRRRGRRPNFIEVTETEDIDLLDFRERIPPANQVEFRGPLLDLPAIAPPPPREASETIDTIEGRMAVPSATKAKSRPAIRRRHVAGM